MKKLIKKQLTLVLCFLMLISVLPVFGATLSNDYSTHWAKDTIASALTSGIAKGYPDGTFKPNSPITRVELFSLVNNLFSFTNSSQATFTDVPTDAWYASVVAKAVAAGYVNGYPNGTIHPGSNISRQEVAVIISSLKSLSPVASTLAFTDATSIPSWSKPAIIASFETGVLIGYPDNSFKPEAFITRAEALVAITRCFNLPKLVSDISVSGITVNQSTMDLIVGGATGTIVATITPINVVNPNVNWTSSNTNVATVMGGIVTALTAGTSTITATSVSDPTKTAVTAVTVTLTNQVTLKPVSLGAAGDFVILAKTGISTVPNSVITGNIGVSPIDSTALTGFSLTADATNLFSLSTQITGKAYAANYATPTPSNLTTAVSAMETAYTDAAGRAVNFTELYSGDISGKTLSPGVYKWGTGILINSDVTLNGGANDVWIFQIGGGITQANVTKIILTGGAQAKNIFWQTADTVAIGTGAHFEGILLSKTNITLGTNASITGRLYAQTAVTLDASTVVAP